MSCGEVNTGGFATHSREEILQLKGLCKKYGAWLHIDRGHSAISSILLECHKLTVGIAFDIFARTLNGPEFQQVASYAMYLQLAADSIAGDAHKLFNVPYDCGFLLCRHVDIAQQVFKIPMLRISYRRAKV